MADANINRLTDNESLNYEHSGPTFIQKEALVYSGVANDFGITLNRGDFQRIKEIRINAPSHAAGAFALVGRKATALSANERDDSHADSVGVLFAEGYLDNGDLVYTGQEFSSLGLRLYLDLGATSETVYVNVKYEFVDSDD